MTRPLRIDIDDHVAVVTLNRPEKMNAVSIDMFDALGEAGAMLAGDRAVRAVVLRGAGEHFCAGIDTAVFSEASTAIDAKALAPLPGSIANRFQEAAYTWRRLEVPVICALHGVAYGAGLQLALAADLRVAAPTARMSIMEIKWGLIPDLAISTTLRGLLAPDRVKELAFSGRIVEAPEALQLGLITEMHNDPAARCMEIAAMIRVKSPDAIRSVKRLVNTAWQLSDAEALALEAELQLGVLGKKNQHEAVMANLQNREPEFDD